VAYDLISIIMGTVMAMIMIMFGKEMMHLTGKVFLLRIFSFSPKMPNDLEG
jgi:hypothetical protein